MTHKIAIIGSGAFACAVYSAVRDVPGNKITMFFKDEDCYADIITKGEHPKMPCVFDTFTKLTLDLDVALKQGKIRKGDNIILEALGGGLTWGAVVIKI